RPSRTTTVTGVTAAATSGFTPVPAGYDWAAIKKMYPPETNCPARTPTDCTLVTGSGPRVLLIGDSNARMFIPTFTALARAYDLTFSVSVRGGCSWQRDLYTVPRTAQYDCTGLRDDLYSLVVPALAPDLIVMVNRDYETRQKSRFA